MYNFSLGMLFAISAMAYTYMVVPDSRPIRDARLARLHGMEMMALDADAEKRIECQENDKELNMEKKGKPPNHFEKRPGSGLFFSC